MNTGVPGSSILSDTKAAIVEPASRFYDQLKNALAGPVATMAPAGPPPTGGIRFKKEKRGYTCTGGRRIRSRKSGKKTRRGGKRRRN
jgi:hypothetical protein